MEENTENLMECKVCKVKTDNTWDDMCEDCSLFYQTVTQQPSAPLRRKALDKLLERAGCISKEEEG